MRDYNEPYYGIECPKEPNSIFCVECENPLYDSYTKQYINESGFVEGCEGCIDEKENDGLLQCDCKKFSAETEYIYTNCETGEVCGCSECLKSIVECYVE